MTVPSSGPLLLTAEGDTLFSRIGEERLRALLWGFYAVVVKDEVLGPIFRQRIGPFPGAGWPVHIARLEGFWRAVTGGPSAYRGQPGPAHSNLGAEAAHFDRWLALWETALAEHLGPSEAQALLVMASRMRVSLQRFALAGAALQGEKS
ncbi:group III truncated hemoglobin [Deinococcus marmoris]|uniref:group III truncated hemoglobin n=1 Tax=Deinococcus marmoris TaxID=249408 RepID=UPI0006917C81|nr:group III truncated hemoglobin [Deinococcus marmoris]